MSAETGRPLLRGTSLGAPMIGTSSTGVKHYVVRVDDRNRARCNPRAKLKNFDRGEATCPRCVGKKVS